MSIDHDRNHDRDLLAQQEDYVYERRSRVGPMRDTFDETVDASSVVRRIDARPAWRWKALTATVGVIGGAALIVLGAVAMARGDLDGSWSLPIVEVAGWPHSPLLGLLEVIAGAALIVVSLWSIGELLVSAVIAGFGVVALLEPEVLDERLSIDSTHAWLLVALGGVALLAALVTYIMSRSAWQRPTGMTTGYNI